MNQNINLMTISEEELKTLFIKLRSDYQFLAIVVASLAEKESIKISRTQFESMSAKLSDENGFILNIVNDVMILSLTNLPTVQ